MAAEMEETINKVVDAAKVRAEQAHEEAMAAVVSSDTISVRSAGG